MSDGLVRGLVSSFPIEVIRSHQRYLSPAPVMSSFDRPDDGGERITNNGVNISLETISCFVGITEIVICGGLEQEKLVRSILYRSHSKLSILNQFSIANV